jgi:hypothetical protein
MISPAVLHDETVTDEVLTTTIQQEMDKLLTTYPSPYDFDDSMFVALTFLHENNLLAASAITTTTSTTTPTATQVRPFWSFYTLEHLKLCAHVIANRCEPTCWCVASSERETCISYFQSVNIGAALSDVLSHACSPSVGGDITPQEVRDFVAFALLVHYYLARVVVAGPDSYERLVTLREGLYSLRESRGFYKCLLPMMALSLMYGPQLQGTLQDATPETARAIRAKANFAASFTAMMNGYLTLPQREPMSQTVVRLKDALGTSHQRCLLVTLQDLLSAMSFIKEEESKNTTTATKVPHHQVPVYDLLVHRHHEPVGSGKQDTVRKVFSAPSKTATPPPQQGAPIVSSQTHLQPTAALNSGIPLQHATTDVYFFTIYLQLLRDECGSEAAGVLPVALQALETLCNKDSTKYDEFVPIAKLHRLDVIMGHLATLIKGENVMGVALNMIQQQQQQKPVL